MLLLSAFLSHLTCDGDIQVVLLKQIRSQSPDDLLRYIHNISENCAHGTQLTEL